MIKKETIALLGLGMGLESLLLFLRMKNPILKNELLYYIKEFDGVYFLIMGIASMSVMLLGYGMLLLIEKSKKRKEVQS